ASGLGPEGREFESLCPDHFFQGFQQVSLPFGFYFKAYKIKTNFFFVYGELYLTTKVLKDNGEDLHYSPDLNPIEKFWTNMK
ncbi:MAG: transposase, partial [Rickettsiaceae bacterium]|nr:transposase [Rickettsiaceae bacterium]